MEKQRQRRMFQKKGEKKSARDTAREREKSQSVYSMMMNLIYLFK